MTTVKNTENNKCWKRFAELKAIAQLVGMENATTTVESIIEVTQNIKNRIII
jgi:hypothetical protein